MKTKESNHNKPCPVVILGTSEIIHATTEGLKRVRFPEIQVIKGRIELPASSCECGLIEFNATADHVSVFKLEDFNNIPLIYTFDFIEGASAIVLFPGDSREILSKENPRLWAAEYIAGYCAFWNMEKYEWLLNSLYKIRLGDTSIAAQMTASQLCVSIITNLAKYHEVKHFPRFYLVSNVGFSLDK